ncbi:MULTISPECIES: alpha/beta fold hydrolase [Gordonia]|uniref:Alpha/beta fold hydrolase n=1 Tax=Gordonia amicalis TaxID=89053 RepID=A0AAE4R296_9ACTN|nr:MULTISPECIES: alpha/beta fold hydrolase [Gordonia]MCZ4579504.1 alpha/beta fold hydrolase [Gordonia amicalis]MCZ4653052.1 alpha/beta fold hydrolase [Gordonia amicalis]MDJ0452095.1 alpha/beta fold hydrolase [Gordonia amicalis]MDV6308166.1 alpha/beta fold hydrolase [Gordonia amicalis]MDV6312023.1 alpha/beta fold hydrolase [Gordonia amicalis]
MAAIAAIGLLDTARAVPSAGAAVPELEWTSCPAVHGVPSSVRCAAVEVPLDHAQPNGPTIELLVSRVPARDPAQRRGVLMGNPGGPGGDGIAMFSQLHPPAEVRDQWDLVAVQPRGLVSGTPLKCAPLTGAESEILTAAGKLNRERCARRTPGLGATLTTENTARDIEVVRRRLGETKISLYGVSYGTLLFATYATLFPQRVDRMVLDSGFDPGVVWNSLLDVQTPGYKARVHAMMAWIARHDHVYHLGTTPLAVYRKWSNHVSAEAGVPPSLVAPPAQVGDVPPGLRAIAEQYIAGTDLTADARARFENFVATLLTPGSVQANSGLLVLTRAFAPDRNFWPVIAMLTAGAPGEFAKPSPAVLEAATVSQDMQAAVLCNENQVPADPSMSLSAFITGYVTADPFEAPGLVYRSGMACAGAPPVARPIRIRDRGLAVRPLQIQSVGDPQTPYRGSLVMQRRMGSHLITVGGGDHAQLGRGNRPLDAAIAGYLRTGRTAVTRVPEAPITASLTRFPPSLTVGATAW